MIYWIKIYFSNLDVHLRALGEVFCVVTFSFIPFFISYFVTSARSYPGQEDMEAWASLFGRGQLYLMAYTLFGTIFWLGFLKPGDRHNARVVLGFIATVAILPVVGFLGIDPTFSSVINPQTVVWGYRFYAALAVIYYLLIFFNNIEPPSAQEILDEGSAKMATDYKRLNK